MDALHDEVARKARAMTRREIVIKAVALAITWAVAAKCLGVSERHMRRIKAKFDRYGVDVAVRDGRSGGRRARRVPLATIEEVCRLKRDVYADYSMKHFHEAATEKHKLKLSYTLMRSALQDAGLVEKAAGRGQYGALGHESSARQPAWHANGQGGIRYQTSMRRSSSTPSALRTGRASCSAASP